MRRGPSGGNAQGSTSDYPIRAFLTVRARLHLGYRLVARMLQLVSPDGGAHTWPWRLLLLGFAGLDVALWAALRNPDRFAFKTRLALDSVDIAVWSLAPYPQGTPYTLAVLVGFPLAVETGLRCRWVGLVVPGVTMTVTMAVRAVVGRPAAPGPFVWLVIGAGWGIVLRRYVTRLQRQAEDEWSRRRSAQHRRAFLAGQNSVAMGASSAVDALEGTVPILGRPREGSVMWDVANSWKSSLYESTTGHAAYLGQVLHEWASEHNRHPDLRSRVELYPSEGIGTTLLTDSQEPALRRSLRALELRGRVDVDLVDPSAASRVPGGPLLLRVGAHLVEVPADPDRPPRPVDPGPTILVLVAVLMVADTLSFAALAPVLPVIALTLAGAWWAHIRLRRRGRAAWPAIMGLAAVIAPTYAAVATVSMVHPTGASGLEAYPVVPGLDLLAILGALYWDGLGPMMRRLAWAAAFAVLVAGLVLHPNGVHPDSELIQVVWVLPVFLTALPVSRRLDDASARYATRLAANDAGDEVAAFRRGQANVIDLVVTARDETRARLGECETTLSPELAERVRQQLQEVDLRLARLARSGG